MSVTIVTGIWDIKRDELTVGWNRKFDHYLRNFEKLLRTEDNMIVYIEEQYKSFVEERRSESNTKIIIPFTSVESPKLGSQFSNPVVILTLTIIEYVLLIWLHFCLE